MPPAGTLRVLSCARGAPQFGEELLIGFMRQEAGFVGREPEMQLLRAGVEDAGSGRGRLLLLIGEPGIGKTRTAEELATYARERGAQVLWGRCVDEEGAPAFWPWAQVLRAAIRDLDSDSLRHALGPGGPDIAEIVPEVRERLPELPPASRLDSPQARFRLFDGVARCFEHLGRRAPLVVILDDLHQADRPSLLLLQFVTREMDGLRLLVVGSCRNVGLTDQHPLSETLLDALRAPRTEQLVLHGLSEAEIGRFIAVRAGATPSAALAAAVHKQTDGNPLFVTEYVRLLLAQGKRSDIENPRGAIAIPVPNSLKAVIRRRLATLSPQCHRLLRMPAAIGREFPFEVLETLASHGLAASEDEEKPAPLPCASKASFFRTC